MTMVPTAEEVRADVHAARDHDEALQLAWLLEKVDDALTATSDRSLIPSNEMQDLLLDIRRGITSFWEEN